MLVQRRWCKYQVNFYWLLPWSTLIRQFSTKSGIPKKSACVRGKAKDNTCQAIHGKFKNINTNTHTTYTAYWDKYAKMWRTWQLWHLSITRDCQYALTCQNLKYNESETKHLILILTAWKKIQSIWNGNFQKVANDRK